MSAHAVRAVASSKPHNANSVESLGRLAGTPLKELPASHFKGGAMTLSDRAPAGLEGDLVNLPRSSGKLTSTNFDGGSMALTASQTGGEVTKRPASPLPTVYSRMPEGVATDRRAATAPSEACQTPHRTTLTPLAARTTSTEPACCSRATRASRRPWTPTPSPCELPGVRTNARSERRHTHAAASLARPFGASARPKGICPSLAGLAVERRRCACHAARRRP